MNEPKKRGRPTNAEREARQSSPAPMATIAQTYAERVWSKQSLDLSRHERLGRVAEALKAQGLSMEGVVL